MSREKAAEQFEAALDHLATAKRIGPGSAALHFANLAHGHALAGIVAALTDDPAPAPDVRPALAGLLTRAGSILISSDCRDGAHRACAGTGWDDAANRAVECPCECHL